MKITLRELRQVIRESVQEQMQQEGIMDKLEDLAAGAGITDPSPEHFAKYVVNDFVKNRSENFFNTSIARHWLRDAEKKEKMESFSKNPSIENLKLLYPEPWDSSPGQPTVDDLKGPYPKLAAKQGAIEKFLASNPEFGEKAFEKLEPLMVPVFKNLIDRALKMEPSLQTEDITSKMFPEPVKESINRIDRMVREEVKRQLRSKR